MSSLVDAFARLRSAGRSRPLIHLPAIQHSLNVDDVWNAQAEYADRLRAADLRAGQLVLLATGNRPATVELFLAARSLGLAVAPVDIGTTGTEITGVSERFGAAAIITATGAGLGVHGHHTTLRDGVDLIAQGSSSVADYSDTAFLKLTSGSSGLPKATRTTETQLIADTKQIVAAMGIGTEDAQIAVVPLSHAYGASVILVPLILQGTPMVLRESFVPHQLPGDARSFDATTFPGVPFMFEYFLANPPPDGWPPNLRRLVSAGAHLPPETIRGFFDRFGVKIHSFYGASESGGISYDHSEEISEDDTVGWPLPGVTITVRPDDDTPAGMGRVHVRSAGVATGYVGEASEAFCGGGFLTGDYGAFDVRGRLTLSGRVSSFINVAGKKVQPAEVEAVLRQMPGVRDVRVLSAPDVQRGEQVVACVAVEFGDGDMVTTLSVRRFCSSRLAPHKIPRTVVFLDAIPLTARGKTDRRALDEAVRSRIKGLPEQLC